MLIGADERDERDERGSAADIGDEYSPQPRFNDQVKATFGAAWTVFLLVVVDLLRPVESPVFGHAQLLWLGLVVFNAGALLLVAWFCLLGAANEFDALFALLTRVMRAGMGGHEGSVLNTGRAAPGRLRRAVTNLWIPVTLQFILAGWLIYASGGFTKSPYNSVPIVMMLIGQSVYAIPSIGFNANIKLLDVLVVLPSRLARAYCYPLSMLVLLLVVLLLLQQHHPLQSRSAPPAEMAFTALLNLFFGMCVVFVTRRADQAYDSERTHTQLLTNGPIRSGSAGPNSASSSPRESSDMSSHSPAAPRRQ